MKIWRSFRCLTARLLDCSTGFWGRVIIGGGLCLLAAVVFFGNFLLGVPGMLDAESLQKNGVYGWGILAVCLFWLFLKKDSIYARMRQLKTGRWYLIGGAVTIAAALSLHSTSQFVEVLRMMAVFLGLFGVFFGRAVVIPAAILGIYAFSLAFPVLTQPLAEGPWGSATLAMVRVLSPLFGLSLDTSGNLVTVTGPEGERISALVTYECAGQITMGIFLALFALMMMDVSVPWKRATWLLVFGIVGTTVQNLVRIEAVLLSAQWWGWAGMRSSHQYVAYVIFPLWYGLFAMVYFKMAKKGR